MSIGTRDKGIYLEAGAVHSWSPQCGGQTCPDRCQGSRKVTDRNGGECGRVGADADQLARTGQEQPDIADKGNCRRAGGRAAPPSRQQPGLLSRSWVLPWASTLGGMSSKPKATLSLAVLTGRPGESASLSLLSLPGTLPAGRDTYTQDTKKLLSFLFSRGPRHPVSPVMQRSTKPDNSGAPRASEYT